MAHILSVQISLYQRKILFTSKNMVKITLFSIIGGLLLDILQYLSWLFLTIFFSIGEV